MSIEEKESGTDGYTSAFVSVNKHMVINDGFQIDCGFREYVRVQVGTAKCHPWLIRNRGKKPNLTDTVGATRCINNLRVQNENRLCRDISNHCRASASSAP